MLIPNFIDEQIVNKEGFFTDSSRQMFMQLFQALQTNLSEEGFVLPYQTNENITILNTDLSKGYVLYNSETSRAMLNNAGVFKNINTDADVAGYDLPLYYDPITELVDIHKADATTDGYLSAIDWNIFNSKQAAGNYITALTGDVTASGPGSAAAAVAYVGTSSAANVHSAELLANAATSLNTVSTIVKRDASGGTAVNLNDSATTPLLCLDAANRKLVSPDGDTTVTWGDDGLKVFYQVYEQFNANPNGITNVQGLSFYNFGVPLTRYDLNYVTVTMTGIWDAKPQEVNLWYEIIGYTITWFFPDVIAAADTATFITVPGIPGPYPIKEFKFFLPQTVDNAVESSTGSLVKVKTDGTIEIYSGTGNFSGSGDSGFNAFCITYSVIQG